MPKRKQHGVIFPDAMSIEQLERFGDAGRPTHHRKRRNLRSIEARKQRAKQIAIDKKLRGKKR